MDQALIEKVMNQVKADLGTTEKCEGTSCTTPGVGVTEFVGTSIGDTIGLVIANVDPMLKEAMHLDKFRSIGIIGGRTGAGPQIMGLALTVTRSAALPSRM